MAGWARSLARLQFRPCNRGQALPLICNRFNEGPWRQYSQYPPTYAEPLYRKENLEEFSKSGEAESLAFTPIKAALNNQTSSIFHDPMVAKFTNYVMKTGNKALARDLMEKTFEIIKRTQLQKYHQAETEEEKALIECNPINIIHSAVENTRPLLQLTPIKRGGVKYQVPVPITEKHSYFVSMRWLVESGREKERKVHFPEKLAKELLDASRNEGRVVKKKQDLHRQCEANRAYAHYRWS
nr:28S ribosomal protein S7, mitochondrial-like [Penaeus vannamei]